MTSWVCSFIKLHSSLCNIEVVLILQFILLDPVSKQPWHLVPLWIMLLCGDSCHIMSSFFNWSLHNCNWFMSIMNQNFWKTIFMVTVWWCIGVKVFLGEQLCQYGITVWCFRDCLHHLGLMRWASYLHAIFICKASCRLPQCILQREQAVSNVCPSMDYVGNSESSQCMLLIAGPSNGELWLLMFVAGHNEQPCGNPICVL
jgi:hypothetical protein